MAIDLQSTRYRQAPSNKAVNNDYLFPIVNDLEALKQAIETPAYKTYVAILNQSGTDAPTANVLQNTLGGEVIFTYTGVGTYLGTLENGFTLDKTFLPNPTEKTDAILGVSVIQITSEGDPNYFVIGTAQDGSNEDNILQNYSLEIRVYN